MSWTDIFPVMGEEMVEDFEARATCAEKSELQSRFAVKQIFNPQNKRHLVSTSLNWMPLWGSAESRPFPTRELMELPDGTDRFSSPWSRYVRPILETVSAILSKVDDVSVRVYLAPELEFIIPPLVGAGCEVYLMQHPSINLETETAWRFLAFSEKERLVTLSDPQGMSGVAHSIKLTRSMELAGLSCWREPLTANRDTSAGVNYRPFRACHLGLCGGWPAEKLLHAFTWHFSRGNFPTIAGMPSFVPRASDGQQQLNAGFEEWFLTVAMYPRVATTGVLTVVRTGLHESLMLKDIEYVTWANSKSELVLLPPDAS